MVTSSYPTWSWSWWAETTTSTPGAAAASFAGPLPPDRVFGGVWGDVGSAPSVALTQLPVGGVEVAVHVRCRLREHPTSASRGRRGRQR